MLQLLEIAFRLASPDLPIILVDLQINNSETRPAIFDTAQGATALLVRQSELRRLGIVKVNRIGLGGQSFNIDSQATDILDPFARAIGEPIFANLGYPFLKDFTVKIDYPSKRITLSKVPMQQGVSFLIGSRKPYAVVEARINGQGPYKFAIDTGSSNSVLSRALAERLMLPRGMPVPVMSPNGTTQAYMTSAESLSIAGRNYYNLNFATADLPDIDGLLGANAFLNFVLTIDYPNKRMSIR